MTATFRPDGELRTLDLDGIVITQNGGEFTYSEPKRDKVRNVPMRSLMDCLAEAKQRKGTNVKETLAFIESEKAKYLEAREKEIGSQVEPDAPATPEERAEAAKELAATVDAPAKKPKATKKAPAKKKGK